MKNFHPYVFIIAVLWFIATAWYTAGYYHPDEHFQIVEFARLKQGLNQPSDLAWEYEAQVRSTIQPVLAYLVFSACKVLHLTNPYYLSFILRLLSAVFLLYTIRLWVNQHKDKFTPFVQKSFIILSYGLFLVPMVSVRFSSETWSAGCILMAMHCLSPEKVSSKKSIYMLGVWLGLAFLFRFQTMFLAAGIFGWLFWHKKLSLSTLMSFAAVVAGGFLLDSWFYGEWVFTFWKYFDYNLLRGVAASFGVSPWYQYALYICKGFTPLVGVLMLLCVFYFVGRYPRHLLTWMIIPFVVVHCIISHKEDRFLFPLVYFLPFILATVVEELNKKVESLGKTMLEYVLRLVVIALLVFNLLGLIIVSFTPLQNGTMIGYYINQHYGDQSIVLLNYNVWESPYTIKSTLKAKHFDRTNTDEVTIDSLCKLGHLNFPEKTKVLLLTGTNAFRYTRCDEELALHSNEWKLVTESIPAPVMWLRKYFGFIKNKNNLLLYERK